ncbi:RNA polymerase ECF family sigma subunit [Micromonospora kangleipakensis]|uniref:RNA polymerase sigma factor n=1 Tax=Micromonospora kangleipakensis TaxID=1077942 RepID=A0A4Q8BI53_9ACTN|nr:RNA polymerase subunit sigma-70 [Micromonospora kangleipakensis]RZU77750.1 RNA polymerase ECF family sigma subunit [Micromonospora kangleipakensis]
MTATSEDFDQRTRPYRRELLAHCYRMLGSTHEAEDLVQETLLRAWRAFDRYDPERASLRTWLHRIATNACLTALRGRARRPLPSDLVAPNLDPDARMVVGEVPWLQPLPDAVLDPATVVAARGSLRLALVAALQLLPPRQRAILILRDVLDRPAAEVAETLATTPAAVNSGLQRARARLGALAVREEQVVEPTDPGGRALVDRYVAAFERADVPALTRLLTADAVLEMPPVLNWYVGREHYGRFIARIFAMRGTDWRMLPTAANGQPALAAYVRDGDGYVPHTLQVLTVTGVGISRNVVFQDRSVFDAFGLAQLPAAAPVR